MWSAILVYKYFDCCQLKYFFMEEKMDFVQTGWALLPPVIAILIALKTKEVYLSLFF